MRLTEMLHLLQNYHYNFCTEVQFSATIISSINPPLNALVPLPVNKVNEKKRKQSIILIGNRYRRIFYRDVKQNKIYILPWLYRKFASLNIIEHVLEL